MKIDDEYTSATKRLIKKTLIGFGVTVLVLIIMAVVIFKKATTPDTTPPEVASASTEQDSSEPTSSPVLFEISTSLPTASASSSPTVTPQTTPTASPIMSTSPSPTSSIALPIASATTKPSVAPSSGKTISSQSNLDGYQTSSANGSATAEIKIGRSSSGVSRGFLSFDLSQISTGTSINKITLRIFQQGTTGSPYKVGSDIKVDHLNFGSTFEPSDYSTSSISSSFATISSNPAPGWKEADVTQNVKGDLTAGRSRSQFRMHFALEQAGGGTTGDFALFESGDNSLKSGNTPQLVIGLD